MLALSLRGEQCITRFHLLTNTERCKCTGRLPPDSMRGAQVKPEDVKGVATAKLRVRVPQCLSWPAIARWNRDGRTRPVGAMRAHL